MLQHARKSDYLAPSLVEPIIDHLVIRVESGGDVIKRLVGLSVFHLQFQDIESVIYLEIFHYIAHVQGIETGLGFPQGNLRFAGLQHLVRMIRAYPERLASVHDILTQSQGQIGNAFLRGLITNGIIIERAQHAAHIGIVMVAVGVANHLLQDNGHLLLVDDIARGRHVSLGVTIVNRGINPLDGAGQHVEHLVLVVQAWYHIGGIDAGEGLVMRIFQQGTAAHGDRAISCLKEGHEIPHEAVWQLRPKEIAQYGFVVRVTQSHLVKVVAVHEGIEDIRA